MGRISNSNNPSDSLAETTISSIEQQLVKKESVRLSKHEQRMKRRQRAKRRLARVLTLVKLLPLLTAPFMLLAGSKIASGLHTPYALKEPKKIVNPHDTLANESTGCHKFMYNETSAHYTQSKR